MSFLKKNSSRITLQGDKKQPKVVAMATKKPLVSVLIIAAIPLLLLIAFTFKSGLSAGKANQKLVVRQTSTELADQATELLQKRDTSGFLDMLEQQLGSKVNIVNSKGDPLLLVAATLGNAEAVRQILLAGADVNKRNTFTKDTALLRALYYTENPEIARLLVNFGADINAVNNYGHSPLFLALEKQRGELIDLFLANGVSEGLNSNYLFRASAKQNFIGVLAMLKGGIDPNVSNEKGNTPLIISSSLGDLPSVRNLLAYRADVNAVNNDGNTALIYAARYNHPEVVRELLKPQTMQAPINVNAQNNLGQTALYWAAAKGYTDIVKRLLAADADATIAANDGLVPYAIAKQKKRTEVLPWFEKNITEVKNNVIEADNAELIAQAKAEGRELPSAQKEAAAVTDADIFKAAETGDVDLARRVLAHNKAVVIDKNAAGDSPLLVAVQNGHEEMVDFLLMNSARLFEASSKGNVFHIATQAQNIDMLKHLVQLARQEGRLALMLEYKANTNGHGPLTPLGLAADLCNKESYDYLVSQGAKPGILTGAKTGVLSPADMMAKCKTKPTQAKQLTPTKNNKKK
ncbi:ankyrin repeat domain-containing protein [Candidatus Avelusimicrobium luingense]|uniref:ankyrin repeat domain-containing protein n=1 Tax=Candidatus Avelusimicrobium luingense TaxID=3416211 RepID=UPI003D0BBE4F